MPATQLKTILGRVRLAMRTRDEGTGLPVQTGALPWRVSDGKGLEVLLVTSRGSSRWLIPKGWPMLGKTLAAAAAQEAYEEAGVRGRIDPQPLGSFRHRKQHELRSAVEVSILVHGLAVEQELPVWPEIGQRERQWLNVEAAAAKVQSPALADLIIGFGARVSAGQR